MYKVYDVFALILYFNINITSNSIYAGKKVLHVCSHMYKVSLLLIDGHTTIQFLVVTNKSFLENVIDVHECKTALKNIYIYFFLI